MWFIGGRVAAFWSHLLSKNNHCKWALLLLAEKHEFGMAMKCSLTKLFTLTLFSLRSVYTLIFSAVALVRAHAQIKSIQKV